MEIKDKKRLTKLISYMAMGDGGFYVAKNCKNAKFIMNMITENEDYIDYVKWVLEHVAGCVKYIRKDYNTDGSNRKPQIRLESKTHPAFTTIRDRIYVGKYKGLDPHTLKLLDFEALSILYMCDGSLVKDFRPEIGMINPSYRVTLNLKRLSYGDQLLLKRSLKEKLDLEFNINRQNSYYYLVLRTKDVNKFMEGVSPYILPSFSHKIVSERLTPDKG